MLTSCEPELQELMRQVDVMVERQRRQWEAGRQELQLQLSSRRDELLTARELIQRRDLEVIDGGSEPGSRAIELSRITAVSC